MGSEGAVSTNALTLATEPSDVSIMLQASISSARLTLKLRMLTSASPSVASFVLPCICVAITIMMMASTATNISSTRFSHRWMQ